MMFDVKQWPDISATAAGTWTETFDEQDTTGAVAAVAVVTVDNSSSDNFVDQETGGVASSAALAAPPALAPSTSSASSKRRVLGWIIAGSSLVVIIVVALSVGLTTRKNQTSKSVVNAAEAAAAAPVVPPMIEPNPLSINDENAAAIVGSESASNSYPPDDVIEHQFVAEDEVPPHPEPSVSPSNKPTSQPSFGPTSGPTTDGPTQSPTPSGPFFFGDEFVTDQDLGLEISHGLSIRAIARAGQPVQYTNGEESDLKYHADTDAAGIIPMNPADPLGEAGYVYVVNSEKGDGKGGVYGLYFDGHGNLLQYKQLLEGTTDNCGGGLTPWNTWISCEEYEAGQCWQVDPVAEISKKTELGGKDGGEYESVAVDGRDAAGAVFFVTEDDERGALRRFAARGTGWDALHSDGDTTFLEILDDGKSFRWTDDEDAARDSAEKHYKNAEGIQFHEGRLYFMAKEEHKMFVLDLEGLTYEWEITGKKFYGEGSFGDQPDQNVFGPTRKYVYFTEDGGDSPGVYARYGEDGTYFTLFQGIQGGMYDDDETVGIALSPDHRRLYAGMQEYGIIFEITREDGLPFE